MIVRTQRAHSPLQQPEDVAAATAPDYPHGQNDSVESGFDRLQWEESHAETSGNAAGGRAVLGWALSLMAILWIGYTAWSAGRSLADQPLSSPAMAQWIAIAAGPLALLGLCWIMFGRTRRKEAEQFTRSVITMRTEARSLETLLGILGERIRDSHNELGNVSRQLMQLGDEATNRLGNVTRELNSSSELVARHGQALDRAAESARNDVAVLLEDLPRAEAAARTMAEQLRGAGSAASSETAQLAQHLAAVSERTREAEENVTQAAQRLVTHLTHIESAGAAAGARVQDAEASFSTALDALLDRTASTLNDIRSGIDTQSLAVAALVDQASAGLGRAGHDSAEALAARVLGATSALDILSAKIAEQERASQRIGAETSRTLAELDAHFARVSERGNESSATMVAALGRARQEFQLLDEATVGQNGAVEELAGRAASLRSTVEDLSNRVREQLSGALTDAEGATTRLGQSARELRPELQWMREATTEACDRIAESASGITEQQDRLTALLASLDDGVGGAEARLTELASSISQARAEATQLSNETGPALVAAMVQVREAASHAADRAREAIAAVVPESAVSLSSATGEALEKVIRESIEDRLREVEVIAAQAVESARAASDRLTQQMISLGQSASALEQHMEQSSSVQREKDSEAFARRVSLLIDSMHSASIDVGKILSDEVDERAWDAYLKGNRGVFTRRAVRLIEGGETRAIRAHYDAEPEFQQSVNRYIHDFEAMLRRVLAERDGGMIAVTLMSSDMGKLYAALAQTVDKRR